MCRRSWIVSSISLDGKGNLYEVDLDLVKRKVLLRFDPFDLSVIQAWYQGERYEDAAPIDLTRPYHRRVKLDKPQQQSTDGLSFFHAAEQRRRSELATDRSSSS